MKTKKDLVKYLADYLQHEVTETDNRLIAWDNLDFETIFEQGLEAFESTENVKIEIQIEDITCKHSFVDGVIADESEEECRFCGWRRKK